MPDPTSSPTSDPTTAPLPTPITDIDVDVDIDDHGDHSIRFEYMDNSSFIVEGDRYSNTYVYTYNGITYRGHDCGCGDFADDIAAQAAYDATGRSLYWLDSDGDGVACEHELGEFTYVDFATTGVRRGGQVAIYPAGSVDTGRA